MITHKRYARETADKYIKIYKTEFKPKGDAANKKNDNNTSARDKKVFNYEGKVEIACWNINGIVEQTQKGTDCEHYVERGH